MLSRTGDALHAGRGIWGGGSPGDDIPLDTSPGRSRENFLPAGSGSGVLRVGPGMAVSS